MKRIFFLLLAVALCGGCASNYNIVLNNGLTITSKGKPKYDSSRGGFYFKNAAGEKEFISQVSVRRVAPQSWDSNDDGKTTKFLQ